MTEELKTKNVNSQEEKVSWIKYKDLLVIPTSCIPEHFHVRSDSGTIDLIKTMNEYIRYANSSGTLPVIGEERPFVIGFNPSWINKD